MTLNITGLDRIHLDVTLNVNITVTADKTTTDTLARILDAQTRMEKKMSQFSDALANLTADVAEQKTVIASAVTYIKGVPALIDAAVQKIIDAGGTPDQVAALQGLSADVRGETASVVEALTANTPNPPVTV